MNLAAFNPVAHHVQDRWLKWLAGALNLLLAAVIAYQISTLALLWIGQDTTAPAPAPPPLSRPADVPAGGTVRIPPPGLFGLASQAPPPDAVTEAPETRLQLTLRGIFANSDAEHGLALIQDSAGNEKHFHTSDEVFGLATVHAIHEDRVILLRNGRYETLKLPKESLGIVIEPEIARKRGQTFAELRRDFLNGDIMKLVKLVGADTAYDERGFIGFKLVALSDQGRQLREQVGLADGDVVTPIDDVEMARSIDAVRNAIAKLKDGQMTSVTVNREGRSIELSIEMPADLTTDENDSGDAEQTPHAATTVPRATAAAIRNQTTS